MNICIWNWMHFSSIIHSSMFDLFFRLLWTKKIWVKWFTRQQMDFLCIIIHIMVKKIICHLWCLSRSKELKNQLQWLSSVLCGQPTFERVPIIPHLVCYLIKIHSAMSKTTRQVSHFGSCVYLYKEVGINCHKSKWLPATKNIQRRNLFHTYNLIECLRPSYRFMLRWLL